MNEILELLKEFSICSIVIRLLLALIFGALIGYERESITRSAGIRTNSLVCIGAALIMLTSQYIYSELQIEMDISRMGAQVVSGIGFIGAGTIISGKYKVVGLTTAAALWVCSGIGLSLGIGFYEGAFATFLITLLTLKVLKIIEKRAKDKTHFVDLYFELSNAKDINGIIKYLKAKHIGIVSLNTERAKLPNSEIGVSVVIKIGKYYKTDDVMEGLEKEYSITLIHKVFV